MSGLVLIVDKEIGFRESLCNYLLMSGYECMLAFDRESTINLVKKHQFDFVIINAFINNEPAIKLLKIVKKFRSNIKGIILSNTAEELASFNKEKEYEYILKPRIFETLPKLLEEYSKKKLSEEAETKHKDLEGEEKRDLKRVEVDLPVTYCPQNSFIEHEEDKKLSKLVNICKQGAMIIADMVLKEKELLNLEILLPPSFRPIIISSQVCWSKRINQTDKYRLGVKFLDMHNDAENNVNQFFSLLN